MDFDALVDDSSAYSKWNITQMFHHTNFEARALSDFKNYLEHY